MNIRLSMIILLCYFVAGCATTSSEKTSLKENPMYSASDNELLAKYYNGQEVLEKNPNLGKANFKNYEQEIAAGLYMCIFSNQWTQRALF